MTSQTTCRELSVTEIFSRSINLYSARFGYFFVPFIATNLVSGVLWQLMSYILPRFSLPTNFSEQFLMEFTNYLVAAIPVAAIFIVAIWVIGTLSKGVATKCTSDLIEGRKTGLNIGIMATLSSFYSLMISGFLTGAIVTLGFILFVFPGVVMAILFTLTVQVIIIEQLGILQCLNRSRRLVAGRWAKTFMVLFSLFFISITGYFIGEVLGDALGSPFIVLKLLIANIVSSITQPLQPIALTYFYYSLRIREKTTEPAVIPQPIRVQPSITRLPTSIFTGFQPKFCYKCGQRLPQDAVYCPSCGINVKPWQT